MNHTGCEFCGFVPHRCRAVGCTPKESPLVPRLSTGSGELKPAKREAVQAMLKRHLEEAQANT